MLRIKEAFRSTLGQKYLTSITGAGLVIFIIFHFIANLTLFFSNAASYNQQSDFLTSLGDWLVTAEVILLILIGIHILVAISLKLLSLRARQHTYAQRRSKDGPSKQGFASTRLLLTGAIILVFLVIHIWQFKFGPGVSEGYAISVHGALIRDLHRLVVETFRKSYWAAFYAVCMIFLGFHLRHGIWSLFQSLGATNKRTTHPIYTIGTALAVIIAAGFALMPIFIILGGGGRSP